MRVAPKSLGFIVLFLPAVASAQVGYGEAIIATEKALQAAAEYVEQNRQELLLGRKTDPIHTQVLEAARGLNAASMELEAERKKLSGNPKANRARLEQLATARKDAEHAKARIKKLLKLVETPKECVAAVKSGALERLLKETSDATKKMSDANAAVNEGLKRDAKEAGSFEVTELPGGNLKLFLVQGGEEEPLQKKTYPIRSLPIILRACVWDDNKARLTEQKKSSSGSVTFETTKGTAGHAFEYGTGKMSSRWDVEEEYRITPVGETAQKIGGVRQKPSDGATKGEQGDLFEISPASDLAKNLTFAVEGKVVKWRRKSTLPGGVRSEDVVPKDGAKNGRLVLSIYPRG